MGDSYPGGQQTLSYQQIQDLWTANGGDPRWAPLMASIAEAESSGHWGVLNDTPGTGDYSVGLWQINYYANLLTPRTQQYGSPATLWSDPNAQAKAAVQLFANGQGAGNWQGDAAYQAWKSAGAPMYPTAAQLANFGAPTGGSAAGAVPAGGGGGGSGSSDGSGGGSGLDQAVWCIPHTSLCMTKRRELAIKGWFLMITGGAVAALGAAFVLASLGLSTKGGQAAAKAIPGIGGQAARVAGGRAPGARRSPPRPPAEAGRRESREIERRYRETERQQGPIGPRGGNPTANRVATRERRGRSVPGPGSRERRERAAEPF